MLTIESIEMIPLYGRQQEVQIKHNSPDECPICHKVIQIHPITGYLIQQYQSFSLLYFCNSCNSFFIKSSNIEEHMENSDYGWVYVEKGHYFLAPMQTKPKEFSKRIYGVSSAFIDIYNQAKQAEEESLSEIAGMGYRKALEFLIKDYLCDGITDEAYKDKILKKNLSACIHDDVMNPNVKLVAEKAVWLGNDEVHYIRKHLDKDISDLKQLIEVTVNWIEMELITKEAASIPKL